MQGWREMKILFVHQNFPGQFLHVAPALARRGHDVLALTVNTNPRKFESKSAKAPMVRTRNICSDPDMVFPHELTPEKDHRGAGVAMIWIKRAPGHSEILYLWLVSSPHCEACAK